MAEKVYAIEVDAEGNEIGDPKIIGSTDMTVDDWNYRKDTEFLHYDRIFFPDKKLGDDVQHCLVMRYPGAPAVTF